MYTQEEEAAPEHEVTKLGCSGDKVTHAQYTQLMLELLETPSTQSSIGQRLGKKFKQLAKSAWSQPEADRPLIVSLILTFLMLRNSRLCTPDINMDLKTVEHMTTAKKDEIIKAINLALARKLSCGTIQNHIIQNPNHASQKDQSPAWWHGRKDHLWHGRCHPNDYSFPGLSKTINHKAQTGPQHLVFALAMHWGFPRDKVRLQMMLNLSPNTRIITVSETSATIGNLAHMNACFKGLRGIRTIAKAITAQKTSSQTVTVLLDYFWMALHYYTSNYGMHWLTAEGTPLLLAAGADCILLPNDKGLVHKGGSGMAVMLRNIHPSLSVEFVMLDQNPLWVASNNEEISGVLADLKGSNKQMTRDFVCPENPFVKITSKPPHLLTGPTNKRARKSQ
jgi:hypothetical protein